MNSLIQTNKVKRTGGSIFKGSFLRDFQLYALLFFPVVFFLVFKYSPMYGITIAFKDYNIFQGVMKSPWVGGEVFKEIFKMQDFHVALRNTFILNFLDLLFSFPAPIVLAVLLNEVYFKRFKKISQTVLYLPHFLSWVIVGGMCFQIFATSDGVINNILRSLGQEPVPFLTEKGNWLIVYIFTGVWHNVGWNTIIYLAALTAINNELYEAAYVDGANRFKRMWHITLPGIKPTIVVLLILALGKIPEIGFERPFMIGNILVKEYSDVLSTFVYRVGLQSGQYSIATAVGLFQSVVGLVFLTVSNFIAKALGEEGIW